MKTLFTALAFTAAQLSLSHTGMPAGTQAVPGYFDPATRIFAPMVTKSTATSAVTRTGTVKISITLTIQSSIGPNEPITCQASISASDASFDNTASAAVVASRSGAKATAAIAIPYNWTMAGSGERASISASCTQGSGYNAGGIGRNIYFTADGFAVPSGGGATTTKSLLASM